MIKDKELIKRVFGSPGFVDSDSIENISQRFEFEFFRFYQVDISSKVVGIVDKWFFAVLQTIDDLHEETVEDKSFELTEYFIRKNLLPLVLINQYENIVLKKSVAINSDYIFFIEGNEIESNKSNSFRSSLLINSIKSRVGLNLKKICPYEPQEPAEGWRFFGRKRELEALVNSRSNFFIMGGRKVGKTSLVKQLKLKLEKQGYPVYFVPSADVETESQLVEAIGFALSPKDLVRAKRESSILDSNHLRIILKKLRGESHKKAVLILDEVGRLILDTRKRSGWHIFAVLREFSQTKGLRIIMTMFQEVLIRQINNYDDPLINFARKMRLSAFSDEEVSECLIEPLTLWDNVVDHDRFVKEVTGKIGNHPYLIQYVGEYLFDQIFIEQRQGLDDILQELLEKDISFFRDAVETMFLTLSYLERWAYLLICTWVKSKVGQGDLTRRAISFSDIQHLLLDNPPVKIDHDSLRLLADRLELRGLLTSSAGSSNQFKISSPVIFNYFEKCYHPIENEIESYYQATQNQA